MSGSFYAACGDCGRRFSFHFPNRGQPDPSNHPKRCPRCVGTHKRKRTEASGAVARYRMSRLLRSSDASGELDRIHARGAEALKGMA